MHLQWILNHSYRVYHISLPTFYKKKKEKGNSSFKRILFKFLQTGNLKYLISIFLYIFLIFLTLNIKNFQLKKHCTGGS